VPPTDLITIAAPVNAFVKSIEVLPGSHVHKGDLLVTLEHPEIIKMQKEYLDTKSQFGYMEKELKRHEFLNQQDADIKSTYEKVIADYESYKSQKFALESQLKLMGIDAAQLSPDKLITALKIYAEATGYVSNVYVNKGKAVRMEDEILRIVNTEHLHAELQVFEKDVERLRENQQVNIKIAEAESKNYPGHIVLLGSIINPELRTLTVHAHFNEIANSLKPGMYISAEIITNTDSLPSLPENAVFRNGKKYFVFAVRANNVFEKIKVEQLGNDGNFIALRLPEGIDENALFVTDGAHTIESQLKVNE
jgi:cobalt-zinc-cadmium efflux system membrane fusion protein